MLARYKNVHFHAVFLYFPLIFNANQAHIRSQKLQFSCSFLYISLISNAHQIPKTFIFIQFFEYFLISNAHQAHIASQKLQFSCSFLCISLISNAHQARWCLVTQSICACQYNKVCSLIRPMSLRSKCGNCRYFYHKASLDSRAPCTRKVIRSRFTMFWFSKMCEQQRHVVRVVRTNIIPWDWMTTSSFHQPFPVRVMAWPFPLVSI